MSFDLPTPEEMYRQRRGQPISKGSTRLEQVVEARKLTKVTDKDFKKDVWTRDKSLCRCCGRKVLKTISRVPERGEVHHIHGRRGDLRFESRAALLLCLQCHERVTGKVNDKVHAIATKSFEMKGEKYTDARALVLFKEMVDAANVRL